MANQFTIPDARELLYLVKEHLDQRRPFSLVRIGDGENFILAQESIHPVQDLIAMYNVVASDRYSGIAIPNLEARDRLLQAVRRATVLGLLHQTDCYCWYPLTEKILSHYRITPRLTCYAFINHYCANTPLFYELFRHTRILLIGRPMARLREVLERRYQFTGIMGVLDLRNYHDLDRVLAQLPRFNFELALISAGANAKMVAVAAMDLGRVGFDFGHAADNIIKMDEKGLFAWGSPVFKPPPGRIRSNPGIWQARYHLPAPQGRTGSLPKPVTSR